jgi:hypothetical protein
VIKPEFPLPLDPDFYFGRVDADALVAMGYRDAKAYLARRSEDGVPWDPSATRMRDPSLGVAFSRRLRGGRGRVDVRDLERFRKERTAELVGVLDDGRIARGGTFRLEGRRQVYELDVDGQRIVLAPRRDTLRLLIKLHATGSDSLRKRMGAVIRFLWLLARG